MRKPMAYITAAWSNNEFEVTETAATIAESYMKQAIRLFAHRFICPCSCVTKCHRSIRTALIWQGICFAVQGCLWCVAVS